MGGRPPPRRGPRAPCAEVDLAGLCVECGLLLSRAPPVSPSALPVKATPQEPPLPKTVRASRSGSPVAGALRAATPARRGRHGRGVRGVRPRAQRARRAQDRAHAGPPTPCCASRTSSAPCRTWSTRTSSASTSCSRPTGTWFFTMEMIDGGVDFTQLRAPGRRAGGAATSGETPPARSTPRDRARHCRRRARAVAAHAAARRAARRTSGRRVPPMPVTVASGVDAGAALPGAHRARCARTPARRGAAAPRAAPARARRVARAARAGKRAPRHQAVQRAGHPDGRVVLLDFGLVDGRARRCRDRTDATRGRHARVHGARAGQRRRGRPGGRLVRRRRDAVRGADRPRARSPARPTEMLEKQASAHAAARRRRSSRDVPADLDELCARSARPRSRRARPDGGGRSWRAWLRRRHGAPRHERRRCAADDARRRRAAAVRRPRAPSSAALRAAFARRARRARRHRRRARRVGHGQERAGAAASSTTQRGPARGRARRPLLRARVGAVQGARRRDRRADRHLLRAADGRGASAAAARRRGRWRGCSRCCGRVPRSPTRPAARGAAPDPQRAAPPRVRALRELLARLASAGRVVLFIDDLQWGDADSAALLAELHAPADAPPLLLIGALPQRGGGDAARCLRATIAAARRGSARRRPRARARGRAAAPDAARRAGAQAARWARRRRRERAETIARESGGNPYFVHELVRFVEARRPALAPRRARGDARRRHPGRVAQLPERAARARGRGRGGASDRAARGAARRRLAIDPGDSGTGERRSRCCAGPLARTRGVRDHDELETYHDRVRESSSARWRPSLRELHHGLAVALEPYGEGDAESLAVHFDGADECARSVRVGRCRGPRRLRAGLRSRRDAVPRSPSSWAPRAGG